MRPKKRILSGWHKYIDLRLTTYDLRLFFLFLVVSSWLLVVSPQLAFAVIEIDEPLIPCGTEITTSATGTTISNPCTFCHFFKLIQNVYNFLVFVIVPPIAVLLVAIGGFFWMSSGGSEKRAGQGMSILVAVGWGLVIVYVSWLVISFTLSLIANPTGATYKPAKWYNPTEWFVGSCEQAGAPTCTASTGRPDACTCENDSQCASGKCENGFCTSAVSGGVSLSVSPESVDKTGQAALSWDIGSKVVDLASCTASTEVEGDTTKEDPLGVIADLQTAIPASAGVGSIPLTGFAFTGTHMYSVTCTDSEGISLTGSASLAVMENGGMLCEADDLSLTWGLIDDGTVKQVSVILIGQTMRATLSYNPVDCSSKLATISIIPQGGSVGETKSEVLDSRGSLSLDHETSELDCSPPGVSDAVLVSASVATDGSTASAPSILVPLIGCPQGI